MIGQKEVKKHLNEFSDLTFTAKKLMVIYGGSQNTISSVLSTMYRNGEIKKVGRGVYASLDYEGEGVVQQEPAVEDEDEEKELNEEETENGYVLVAVNKTFRVTQEQLAEALEFEYPIVGFEVERDDEGDVIAILVRTSSAKEED